MTHRLRLTISQMSEHYYDGFRYISEHREAEEPVYIFWWEYDLFIYSLLTIPGQFCWLEVYNGLVQQIRHTPPDPIRLHRSDGWGFHLIPRRSCVLVGIASVIGAKSVKINQVIEAHQLCKKFS